MNFDFQRLGKKFKFARESLLMDERDVANRLNVSVDEYRLIEEGKATVSGDTVVKLSNIFHRDFRDFVTNDKPNIDSQIHEMYRQNANITPRDRISIQDFIQLCETKAEFEKLLGADRRIIPEYHSRLNFGGHAKSEGPWIAEQERNRLGISDNVGNLYVKLRQQNVHVFRRQLSDDSISGLYIRHPDAGHCILINYNDDVYRQNFSMAHEYAHALVDSSDNQIVTYHKSKPYDLREVRANTFASCFLLPSKAIDGINMSMPVETVAKLVASVSRKYGVTHHVVLIRLRQRNLITEEVKRRVERLPYVKVPVAERIDPELRGVSENHRSKMLEFIKNGLSVQYIELCRQVYHEGLVSFGRIMEALQLSYEQGQELMSMWNTFLEV